MCQSAQPTQSMIGPIQRSQRCKDTSILSLSLRDQSLRGAPLFFDNPSVDFGIYIMAKEQNNQVTAECKTLGHRIHFYINWVK